MKEFIKRYEANVANLHRVCDTLEDENNALHEIFNDMFYELKIRSGIISPLQFLQCEINKILGDIDDIKVLQKSSKDFDVIIGVGSLVDETKTQTYVVSDIKFTIYKSIEREFCNLDDAKLGNIIASYTLKNGGKLWN